MNLMNDFEQCAAELCVSKHCSGQCGNKLCVNKPQSKVDDLICSEQCSDQCPICMDDIDPIKNRLITECGHIFHTSCLMKNASLNGFGCPMCRAVMAEEEVESDDESDDEPEELYSDYALRGMRLLFQAIEGELVEPDEDDDETISDDTTATRFEVPSIGYLMEQMQIHHISPERLLKCIISSNYDGYPSFEPDNDAIFNLLDTIIIDFVPTDVDEPVDEPVVVEESTTTIGSIETTITVYSEISKSETANRHRFGDLYKFPYDENYDMIERSDEDMDIGIAFGCEFGNNSDDMQLFPTPNMTLLYPNILPYDPVADEESLDRFYEMAREVNAKHDLAFSRINEHLKLTNNNGLNHSSAVNSWYI